jgi:hypothetical protein
MDILLPKFRWKQGQYSHRNKLFHAKSHFPVEKKKINVDNEKLFIENFNQSIYQPDLLFDDKGIIERIKEHPMAVWRIKHIL